METNAIAPGFWRKHRDFFIGGNPLYIISAGCILAGVFDVVVPIYKKPDLVVEQFAALIALGVYELALLAVTLIILRWRRIYEDAVALTVLISMFMVTSAVTLNTVAPTFPDAALALGVAGLILAGIKMAALDRLVVGPIGRLRHIGVGVLLAWNFLAPGLMGHLSGLYWDVQARGSAWMVGGLVVLTGASILLADAWRIPTGQAPITRDEDPFLRTPPMRWIVTLILLAGTFVHLNAMSWAFGLKFIADDLALPLVMLAAFILEIRRGYTARPSKLDWLVILVPLAAVLLAVMHYGNDWSRWPGKAWILHPAIATFLMAGYLAIAAWRRKTWTMHLTAGAYLATGLWVMMRFASTEAHISRGWLLIALSFMVLTLGALVSMFKPVRAVQVEQPQP